MLDEDFRKRIAALAAADDAQLDAAAQARIVDRVASEGPALVRAAARRRAALRVAAPALAVAAAVAVIVGTQAEPSRGPAPVVTEDAPACESWPPRAAAPAFVEERGRRVLDLGAVAFAATPLEASVTVVESERCRTVLELVDGSVVVHARDLGGGELDVRAAGVDVSVRGTLFSVGLQEGGVLVEVLEGVVAVRQGAESRTVRAGRRLLVSPVGMAAGEVDDKRGAVIRRAVEGTQVIGLETLEPSAPPSSATPSAMTTQKAPRPGETTDVEASAEPVEETAETPGQMLARAESLRRAGRVDEARSLYRAVGTGTGATAEAAWLALARMELAVGNAAGAKLAAEERRSRFGAGSLGPEARWIDVRTHRLAGDESAARAAAEDLVKRWPRSPQADAARRWLASD